MGRCIIHIGMHKTGTSSIQQSLEGFSDDSFIYADIGRSPNHSQALAVVFALDDEDSSPHTETEKTAQSHQSDVEASDLLEKLERSIRVAEDRTFLVSGEGISLFPAKTLARMREFFLSHFEEVTIIAAIRPPAGFMGSAFQEPLKRGGVPYDVDLKARYRSYRRIFEKFDDVFGRRCVRLWKFDPTCFPNGCAVRDFCKRLEIRFPEQRIVRVNESLSREALSLLFVYRKFGQHLGSMSLTGPQNLRLVESLTNIGTTRFRISPDVLRPVLEANRDDIEWMEDRLGESLDEALGGPAPEDVHDLADLANPSSEAVNSLLDLLGSRAPHGIFGESPRQIALLVNQLRKKEPTSILEPMSLVHGIRQNNPDLLGGVSEDHVEQLLRSLFEHINRALVRLDDDVLEIADFGRFHIQEVDEITSERRPSRPRIFFHRDETVYRCES